MVGSGSGSGAASFDFSSTGSSSTAGSTSGAGSDFAVTVTVRTGEPLLGAVLFPVGFCLLYLLGFDLLTGVFTLVPLALIDRRPGVTVRSMLRNWGLVFAGNFAGAFVVAVLMAIIFTYGFSLPPDEVGRQIGEQLFLAEKTVKNYVTSILGKLGMRTRTQAAVLASKLLE